VTVPFGMGELLARLRALLRRAVLLDEVCTVATDDFTIDLAARRIRTATGDIHVTSTEWRLIEVLVRNAGKVVTQGDLLRLVWGPGYGSETQYLRVYLKQIRSKLEPIPSQPRYFLTHRGLGVRFNNDEVGPRNVNEEGAPPLGPRRMPSRLRVAPEPDADSASMRSRDVRCAASR
jgi:two-component system, OmpR family, KDP operon response regulator KdpE